MSEVSWEPRAMVQPNSTRHWQTNAPSAFNLTSSLPTRRRSSAASNAPPAGPPPNHQLPRIPPGPSFPSSPSSSSASETDDDAYFPETGHIYDGGYATSSNFAQPSSNLAAVASFSQSRFNSIAHSPQPTASTSEDSLLDSPPRSILPASISRIQTTQYQQEQGTSLLAPPQPTTTRPPSSRRALTRALELAREAVQLDSTNNDPEGAVIAYGRSVALLSEVMERVRRGEDSTDSSRRRNGRRRSIHAQEEEVKRLKSIHDTYADRMNILSLIYSIAPIPHSPGSIYASTMAPSTAASTQPPSPTSDSPASEIPDPITYPNYQQGDYGDSAAVGALGDAMFDEFGASGTYRGEACVPSTGRAQSLTTKPSHPYAAAVPQPITSYTVTSSYRPPIPTTPTAPGRRARSSSALPPPPPPPSNILPPAPTPIKEAFPSSTFNYTEPEPGHQRTASEIRVPPPHHFAHERSQTQYRADEYSQMLAPSSPPQPRGPSPIGRNGFVDQPPPSPRLPNYLDSRSQNTSNVSLNSEQTSPSTQQHKPPLAVNPSGTLYQRRIQTHAGDTSPTESNGSAASSTSKLVPIVTTSGPTPTSVKSGRIRSNSQPGRRPSLLNGRVSPLGLPPLPSTTARKFSNASKLNPAAQLMVRTDLMTYNGAPPAGILIPQPPVTLNNLPTTPMSPLPPLAPTDALRKPYHMMNLLRTTMTSKSGGYVTRRLHVPQEVWSQGGAKLMNIIEKVRVVEALCSALEDLENFSANSFGGGSVATGMGGGVGTVGRKEAESWIAKLEEFSAVCDSVVANFGKKLGVGEGFVLKKTSGVTSWGGKLTRQIDKITNGKNLDSPAAYVNGLTKLFSRAQLLDEHTRAAVAQPLAPTYAAFPPEVRTAAEAKLRRCSEFFASVVLTFVIRDLSQLLDKYAKKCEKWLAE